MFELKKIKEQWMRGFLTEGEVVRLMFMYDFDAYRAYEALAGWKGACNADALKWVLDNGAEATFARVRKYEAEALAEWEKDFPTEEAYQEMRDFYGVDG